MKTWVYHALNTYVRMLSHLILGVETIKERVGWETTASKNTALYHNHLFEC